MNKRQSAKIKHALNIKTLKKLAPIFIIVFFVLSAFLAVSPNFVQAATVSEVAVSSATASSYDNSHTPNNAVNGDNSYWDYWGTNAMTTGKLPQWLQLDLGTQKSISQITTHFYDGDSRTYTYYIQASTDASNWNTIVPTKNGQSTVTDTFNPTTVRYVKITVTGNTANQAAHIIEISIYQTASQTTAPAPTVLIGTATSEVAVSSATASSYDNSHTPNNAVNGDNSYWDYWGTNAMTTGKLPQWLQLDLGTQKSISQITTHFYDGDSRTYTYYIQASTDASNWNTIVPTKNGQSTVTDTFNPTTVRYVKITVTGNTANQAAHIIEISIYQTASQTTAPAPTVLTGTATSEVAVSSATASSYDNSHTPNNAVNGDNSYWDYWGTNAMTTGKLPQWLQLDLGTQKSISQITTHFYDGDSRTYTYYIQASTDASTWNTIVPTKNGQSTVTDTFNPTTVRYVKITVTGNTANQAAHIIEISIYQTASQTTAPAPTVLTGTANLEPLSSFYSDMNTAASSYASLDYSVTHNGNPSIWTGPDYVRGTREVDGTWVSVKPGDHVVFSAWIKSAPFTSSVLFSGAEIGFDFYISSSQGGGIATIDSAGHQAGHPNEAEIANDYSSLTGGITYVNWGSDWTLITWDFNVPTTYYSYVTKSSVLPCNPVQISSMVPWLGGREPRANAYIWFADTAFYINP